MRAGCCGMGHMRRPTRPSAALVIASLVIAAALAPPAYSALAPKLATNTVRSPQIKDKSIRPRSP